MWPLWVGIIKWRLDESGHLMSNSHVWWSSPFLGLSGKPCLCVYIWLWAFLQRPPLPSSLLPSSPICHLETFCHVQRKWKHLLGNEFWFQTLVTAGRRTIEKPCDIFLLSFIPVAGYPKEKCSAQLSFLPLTCLKGPTLRVFCQGAGSSMVFRLRGK